jgi:phage tail sheath gpL-like
VAITALSGGATNPDLTAALAALGDEEYDFIIHPGPTPQRSTPSPR